MIDYGQCIRNIIAFSLGPNITIFANWQLTNDDKVKLEGNNDNSIIYCLLLLLLLFFLELTFYISFFFKLKIIIIIAIIIYLGIVAIFIYLF